MDCVVILMNTILMGIAVMREKNGLNIHQDFGRLIRQKENVVQRELFMTEKNAFVPKVKKKLMVTVVQSVTFGLRIKQN